MKTQWFLAFALATFAVGGCNRSSDTQEVETQIKSETDAAGRPIETEAEIAGRLPNGDKIDIETKTIMGEVVEYEAGRSLKVKSADGQTHSFDLDENDTRASVETSVKIGSHVEVVVEKQKDQPTRITVAPHA